MNQANNQQPASVKPSRRAARKAQIAEDKNQIIHTLDSTDLSKDELENLNLEEKAKYYKEKLDSAEATVYLSVDKIIPTRAFFNRDPSYFKSPEYLERKDSIKKNGILIPIEVRPIKTENPNDDYYEIVFGNTRHHAAKALGMLEVPVQIRKNCSDEDIFTRSQIENAQRTDPSAWENGKRWSEIIEDNDRYPGIKSQMQIAEIIGKTQSVVSKSITIYKEIPSAIADVFESKQSINFPLLELAKAIKKNESLRRIYTDGAEIVRDIAVSDDVRLKIISDTRLFEEFVMSDEAIKFVARSISIQEKLDSAYRDIAGLEEVIGAADSTSSDVKKKAKDDIRSIELDVINRAVKEKTEIQEEVVEFITEIVRTIKEDDDRAEFERRLAKQLEDEAEDDDEDDAKGTNGTPRNPAPEPLSVAVAWSTPDNDLKTAKVNLKVSPKVEGNTERGVRKISAKKDDVLAEMFLQYIANNAQEMIKQLVSEGKLRPEGAPTQGNLIED